MAAYRRVYDSRHLQADCKEPESAPEPYARQSSMGYLYFFTTTSLLLLLLLLRIIDTALLVDGRERYGVRLSLSVPAFGRRTPLRRVCCCGPGEQAVSICCCTVRLNVDNCSGAAASSRCGQCHVVSRRRRPNANLLRIICSVRLLKSLTNLKTSIYRVVDGREKRDCLPINANFSRVFLSGSARRRTIDFALYKRALCQLLFLSAAPHRGRSL